MTAGEVAGTLAPRISFDVKTADGAVSVGLSYGHISPCQCCSQPIAPSPRPVRYSCRLARGGRLVRVSATSPAAPRSVGWRRAHVAGFSRRARSRFLQVINSINYAGVRYRPPFVTLTMPGEGWYSDGQIKRFMDTLWKRMVRGWWQTDKRGRAAFVSAKGAAALWRLEYQERGAPHLHLIVFGLRYIDRHWLSRAWYQIVGSGQPDHLKSGTNVERPEYWNEAGGYLAAYVAKQAKETFRPRAGAGDAEWSWDAFTGAGRVWGILGRANLPTDITEIELPEWAFECLKDVLVHVREGELLDEPHWAPYRGIWATCGPGPVRPILELAGLLDPENVLS